MQLHSSVLCTQVVMPVEGFYFCGITCVHVYNSAKDLHGITEIMPDDGPGNRSGTYTS